ncbi:MAG: 4-alpha-glucanotransferase [Planctomycetota bacterium]|jgi:4-alpha-glucanotransferase|nr:4-alpha-glucanotransferase [Planctomycetota bacterium]
MPFPRLAGVVLHPTSLPGGHGVGDIGASARDFVDFLADSGMGIWQVLPLGPTGDTYSPYQLLSSQAGNPLLISLDNLVEMELLDPADLEGAPANADQADYLAAAAFKGRALRLAFDNFIDSRADVGLTRELEDFCNREKHWLDDFALFVTAREFFRRAPWCAWGDAELRRRGHDGMARFARAHSLEIRFHRFLQFIFFRQWRNLRLYAAKRNVRFFGDIPIYCAHDSVDVWANPSLFRLDANGGVELMAGVPPDYFSATGQLWGNPVYDWKAMRGNGFLWWRRRLRASLSLVDMLRVDHFRGFEAYWAVPSGETTAINGKWIKGPGQELFDAFRKDFGDRLPIVAEDLGVITPAVEKLRLDNRLPGMKVLHFAFCDGAEAYLPHTYVPNTVCYVATHDNNTTRGWYEAAGPEYANASPEDVWRERDRARRYLGRDGSGMAWDMMRLAMSSVADTAMLIMQDVLNLPNSCRLNQPGLGRGQWRWRLTADDLARANRSGLRDMAELYGRQPIKPERKAAEDVEAGE